MKGTLIQSFDLVSAGVREEAGNTGSGLKVPVPVVAQLFAIRLCDFGQRSWLFEPHFSHL